MNIFSSIHLIGIIALYMHGIQGVKLNMLVCTNVSYVMESAEGPILLS